MTKEKLGYYLIGLSALLVVVVLTMQGPIPQAPSYHQFSDANNLLGIPHALNVLSNLAFLAVGLWGLWQFKSPQPPAHIEQNSLAYTVLFLGTALVALGSGYYHLHPSNDSLLWDRLPMTLAFMSLFSVIISEYIKPELGEKSLYPLIGLGVFAALYWHWTEGQGMGDLRFYAMVQFFPMLAIPVILLCFKPTYSHGQSYWWLLAWYIAAKVFEHYDAAIHDVLGVLSGHSLKHIAAAIGLFVLLRAYRQRRPL